MPQRIATAVLGVGEVAHVGRQLVELAVVDGGVAEGGHQAGTHADRVADLGRRGVVQLGRLPMQQGAAVACPGVARRALEPEDLTARGPVGVGVHVGDRWTAAAGEGLDVVLEGADDLRRVEGVVPGDLVVGVAEELVGVGDRHAPRGEVVVERRPSHVHERWPAVRSPGVGAVAGGAVGEEGLPHIGQLDLRAGRGARSGNEKDRGGASDNEGNGEEQARGDGPGRQPRRATRRHRTGREHTHSLPPRTRRPKGR